MDELHRRVANIVADAQLASQEVKDLHLWSLAGKDAVIATFDRSSVMMTRPTWAALRRRVQRLKPTLVILDTLADFFGGNEIDRTQTRAFVGLLRGLAIEFGCAVLLLSHPSVAGLTTRNGTSGSTAWSNSVRSRLYLERPHSHEGVEVDDADVRVLSVKKANYGRIGEKIPLRWRDGVFIRDSGVFDAATMLRRAEGVFIKLLRLYGEQGRDVSDKKSSTYAPAIFAKHPDAENITAAAFQRAMETLLASGAIAVEEYGPPSRRRSRLVMKSAA